MPNSIPTDFNYITLINYLKGLGNLSSNYTPLKDSNGQVLVRQLDSSGLSAEAFVNVSTNQIVVAFRGILTTDIGSLWDVINGRPSGAATADTSIANGARPSAIDNAVTAFMNVVQGAASFNSLSIDSSNIFVAGDSLGGYEAQIAALTFGYGGASYGGPGIPGFVSSIDRASNFTSYVENGDPIGNFATDTEINWGRHIKQSDHWGNVKLIGQSVLHDALQMNIDTTTGANNSLAIDDLFVLGAAAAVVYLAKVEHNLTNYAKDILNSTLTPKNQVQGFIDVPFGGRNNNAVNGSDNSAFVTYNDEDCLGVAGGTGYVTLKVAQSSVTTSSKGETISDTISNNSSNPIITIIGDPSASSSSKNVMFGRLDYLSPSGPPILGGQNTTVNLSETV